MHIQRDDAPNHIIFWPTAIHFGERGAHLAFI